MTKLRQKMIEDLEIRNYSPKTIETYTYHVACFAKYFGQSPDQLGPEDIRQYQLFLVRDKKSSWSSFNQAVCALRFLYRHTIVRPWHVEMIPFGKRPKRLPTVLGQEEVQRLLSVVRSCKTRTILTTLYAAGLRLSEALHLRVMDVDSSRMQLVVMRGKGDKGRLVPLSPRLLEALRGCWRETHQARKARSDSYLFPGKDRDRPLSETVVQKACREASREAGLHKRVTPHTLRHSYATGLLEAGVDLLTIGQLLGHRSFGSTLIYLHVRRPHLNSTPSPFDWLPVEQCPQWTREPTGRTSVDNYVS